MPLFSGSQHYPLRNKNKLQSRKFAGFRVGWPIACRRRWTAE